MSNRSGAPEFTQVQQMPSLAGVCEIEDPEHTGGASLGEGVAV